MTNEDLFKLSFKTQRRSGSLEVLSTGLQRCGPGYGWGPGVRDHFLIHLVRSGSGSYIFNGETEQVHAGQLFIIYPQTTVRYQADNQDPWEYVWVGFDGLDAPFLLNQAGFSTRRPVLAAPAGETAAALLLTIYECRGSQVHDQARMTGRLYEFLALLIEQAAHDSRLPADPARAQIQTAAEFIAGNYSRPISAKDIAAYAGLSRSALYRGFRRLLGVSPQQLVITCRIDKASALLRDTDTPIAGVARSVGFEDPLYFSRAFKIAQGCSPSEYRLRAK